MTEREEKFIKCVRKDPEKAARILKFILEKRTSSKTNPAPQR